MGANIGNARKKQKVSAASDEMEAPALDLCVKMLKDGLAFPDGWVRKTPAYDDFMVTIQAGIAAAFIKPIMTQAPDAGIEYIDGRLSRYAERFPSRTGQAMVWSATYITKHAKDSEALLVIINKLLERIAAVENSSPARNAILLRLVGRMTIDGGRKYAEKDTNDDMDVDDQPDDADLGISWQKGYVEILDRLCLDENPQISDPALCEVTTYPDWDTKEKVVKQGNPYSIGELKGALPGTTKYWLEMPKFRFDKAGPTV